MNPRDQLTSLIGKPIQAVSNALNRPTSLGRNRTIYPLAVIDALRGGSLEDAVGDRIVMITGASSGIGAATARQIGAAGGNLVLVARGQEKLEETAAEVREAGGTARIYPCDLTDKEAIAAMCEAVIADLGGVDILVNNAGRSIRRSLALSYDRPHDYERTMELNYFAPVQLMLKLLPGMRERHFGHVVNVSSAGVQTRVPRFGAYIASKAALDTLCDAWQAETHTDNVHFTTVHMALVRTPMIEATTIYNNFPTLSAEEAGDVLCQAIIRRPRRVSPPFGSVAALADSISPQIMDRVRSRGYHLFDDSSAAKGEEKPGAEPEMDAQRRAFAGVTRGQYW